MASLQLPKGSKVITPACTFSTTVAPIIQLDLEPVFCDVELRTYVPSTKQVMELVDSSVKAIVLPNLIGNKPNWKELKYHLITIGRSDIVLIEDSADTITFTEETDISTTSFYASHIITAGGSGGMVMYNDIKLRDICLNFRDWGRIGDDSEIINNRFNYKIDNIEYDYKFLYSVLGYNMKCSEMNAAFGLCQLNRLEKFMQVRRKNIERYINNLNNIHEIILPDDTNKSNWLAMPLQSNHRYKLLSYLESQNIQTRVIFAGNITRHPAYRKYLQKFLNSDKIMKNGFLLGSHHAMSIDDVDYVCNIIKKFCAENNF